MIWEDRTRLKVWLVLVGVFLLGGVTGASLGGIYHLRHRDDPHNRDGRREAFFERMRSDLNLTNEQATQIKNILDETRSQFQFLQAEARPRFDSIKQKERERIRGILDSRQQQRFDQITARHDAMREQRERNER